MLIFCPTQPNFRNGVTNGASWYPITGGMKDFSYQYTGSMEVVVEVSDCKFPHRAKLIEEWENNREPILTLVEQGRDSIGSVWFLGQIVI